MSIPTHNDLGDTDSTDNEIINNTINSFLQNISNSVYNNTFLETDDSNTYFNHTFISDIQAPATRSPNIEPPTPPSIEPHNRRLVNENDIVQFNHPDISSHVGNRFLLHPTSIMFGDILPNGTYRNRRYLNATTRTITQINENSVLNSVIRRSFNDDGSAFKQIISDEGKKILKPVPFLSLNTEETKCTIMQELFEDDTVVVELPCKHVFCEEAIMHWLENESATCPVCRTTLPFKEIRIEKNSDINDTHNPDVFEHNYVNEIVDDTRRTRSYSAPISLTNISTYQSIINNIARVRDQTEEEDTQQAIWNSISTSSS